MQNTRTSFYKWAEGAIKTPDEDGVAQVHHTRCIFEDEHKEMQIGLGIARRVYTNLYVSRQIWLVERAT